MWSVVIDLSKLSCGGPYNSWLFFSTHGDPIHCLYTSPGLNVLTMKKVHVMQSNYLGAGVSDISKAFESDKKKPGILLGMTFLHVLHDK